MPHSTQMDTQVGGHDERPGSRGNPELQSALVRITTSVVGALYIGLGAWLAYYSIDVGYFLTIFAIHFGASILLLISVTRRPDWPARRYVALCLDVIVTSLAISITHDAISPFYLLYILIFISAGTRYGRRHLIVASVVAVIAYNFVLIELDEWQRHPFEAGFFLLLLVLLPLYQASLLRQLQRAREEAERANAAKGEFLATMTHELRTPLTGVIGMTEVLKGTPLDLEQRDCVHSIESSANILNALIGDILDLSKIDAGKLVLERIRFDPRTLVRETCGMLEIRALGARLELILDVAPDVPSQVIGDPLRVGQILFNLVGNAIKFTERGHVLVRLRVARSDGELPQPHLLLEVADTGIGISQERLAVLFEGFRQAEDSTSRRFGGTGLGTTIARKLARLMGGRIAVRSREGEGTAFEVRLPLLSQDAPPDAGRATGRLQGLVALVSEPYPVQREILLEALGDEQCRAAGIDETRAAETTAAPDLLVLADTPEGRDLASELERIRARLGPEIPALLLTYVGRRCDASPAATLCLNKPFLPEDLVAAAERLTGRASDRPTRIQGEASAVPAKAGAWPADIAAGMRVLVAEDNAIAAKVISAFLDRMGLERDLFTDGEAALEAALGGGYRIAIVDLRMPKLDGIDFLRRYRRERPADHLPIVVLTANVSQETRRACLEAGMDDFLAKPVRLDELRETIDRLVVRPLFAHQGHAPSEAL